MEKVLVVEEVFSAGKVGVIVFPPIPLSEFKGKLLPTQVELRFKDGTTKIKGAEFNIPRQSSKPDKYSLICHIRNLKKSECPVGAEVWANVKSE